MTALFELRRPRSLAEIVGQKKIVSRLKKLRSYGGRAFLITGPSGSGKTTIANIIANDVADEFSITEMDSSGLTPKVIQDWERTVAARTWGKGGWGMIVNECHGLRKDTIRQLLVTLERLPPYVVVVLTTTNSGQQVMFDECIDAGPLTSRCIVLALDTDARSSDLEAGIVLRESAKSVGLDDLPLDAYVTMFRSEKGNWRACFNKIESGDV